MAFIFVWQHGKILHCGPDKKKLDELSFRFCKQFQAFCILFEGFILFRSKVMDNGVLKSPG